MSTSQVEVRSYHRRGLHVADARAATRDILRSWQVDGETTDDVTLVVSELIANAVRHTLGPVVMLTLTLTEGLVMVEVFDSSTCLPSADTGQAESDAESGRGLRLIEALSVRSGARADTAGKVVWAQILCTPAGAVVV